MANEPKTIGGQISCLARLTGAPDSFVEQVRTLFLNKGLSLEDEATPYVEALEEAFRREEMIRLSTERARDSLGQLQEQFGKLGDAYRRQLTQLRRMRGAMGDRTASTRRSVDGPKKKKRLLIATDRPSVVTRTQRDNATLVPGPSDPQ